MKNYRKIKVNWEKDTIIREFITKIINKWLIIQVIWYKNSIF